MKPSGRCHVPPEIHEQWKRAGAQRDQLMEMLEGVNWDKALRN